MDKERFRFNNDLTELHTLNKKFTKDYLYSMRVYTSSEEIEELRRIFNEEK